MNKSEIFSKKMHFDGIYIDTVKFYIIPYIWKLDRPDWIENDITKSHLELNDIWKARFIYWFYLEIQFTWRIDWEKFEIYLLEKQAESLTKLT